MVDIIHSTVKVPYTPGTGVPNANQTLPSADWNAVHAHLVAGTSIAITSDGGNPPTFTISVVGGGSVGGSGTPGTLTKWATATTLADSLIRESGTDIIAAGRFLPSADNAWDLGLSVTQRWRNANFSGVISAGTFGSALVISGPRVGAPIPGAGSFDASIHIEQGGAGTLRFNCNGGDFYFGTEYGAQPIAFFFPSNDGRVAASWSPLVDVVAGQSLGLVNKRWTGAYIGSFVRITSSINNALFMQLSHDNSGTGIIQLGQASGNALLELDTEVVTMAGSSTGDGTRQIQLGGSTLVAISRVLDPGGLTFNLQLNAGLAVQPDTDNARDLGQIGTPLRWRNGYFAGTLSVGTLAYTSLNPPAGGGLSGGTPNAIPLWASSTVLSNSIMGQVGTTISVGGALNVLTNVSAGGQFVTSSLGPTSGILLGYDGLGAGTGQNARYSIYSDPTGIFIETSNVNNSSSNIYISQGGSKRIWLYDQQTGSIRPNSDQGNSLGTSSSRWATVYTTQVQGGNVDLELRGNAAVKPISDNATNLGTATRRWASTSTLLVDSGATLLTFISDGQGLYFDGHSDVNNVTLHPSTDNTYSLGKSGNTWKNLRIGTSIGVGLAPSGTAGNINASNIVSAGGGLQTNGISAFGGSAVVDSAVGGSQNKKLQVTVEGVTYFIPLNTS